MEKLVLNLNDIVGGGYKDFWNCTKRYRVCKGSRASKKSKTTAINIIYRMMKYPLMNWLVVRKTFNTLKDSCWSDLRWATMRLQVSHLWSFNVSPLSATYKPTGQQIFFRGLDDPLKLASISCPIGVINQVWVEEAYEIETEQEFDLIDDVIRGELPIGYFKQITLTFNPWSSSSWLKSRFFDNEREDTLAITTTYQCNEWLDEADLKRFQQMEKDNPSRYKVAGLGDWGMEGKAFFEEWRDEPSQYKYRQWTHVIDPFEIPDDWKIYRGFDFGYARPFSCGWFAIDHDGTMYHIVELYGCTGTPNEGVKWSPDVIFNEIKRIENEHRWLKGKQIRGIADPSIWDASRGESIAEMAGKCGVYFDHGDNKRIAGWMQCHYRLQFDDNGIPMFYVFNTCKNFIRTVPQLVYDSTHPEDLDSDMEDHTADMWRYVCMGRPMKPPTIVTPARKPWNPLDDDKPHDNYDFYRKY